MPGTETAILHEKHTCNGVRQARRSLAGGSVRARVPASIGADSLMRGTPGVPLFSLSSAVPSPILK